MFSLAAAGGVLAAATSAVSAENRVLSMQDCIQGALQHNLDVQIQKLNPEVARFSLHSTYASYDPMLNAGANYSKSTSPGGVDSRHFAQLSGLKLE